MALAFLPMYVDILGANKFAVIGFYLVCQAVVSLLDTAITATVNRELAESRLRPAAELSSSVRTLEIASWSSACALMVIGSLLTPFLASKLHLRTGVDLLECRIDSRLMVCAISTQGLLLFYLSCILAIQKHYLYAGLRSLWFTGRFAGGVICLTILTPNPSVFLWCQCVTTITVMAILRYFLWQSIPAPPRLFLFDRRVLVRHLQFLVNVVGITATTVLLCQADKLVLFNFVDPSDYAFYIAVWSLVGGVRQLVEPLFVYLLPNFTNLVCGDGSDRLKLLFRASMQLAVVIAVPASVTAAFFSEEILAVWLKGFILQWHHHVTYVFLLTGMCLNAIALIPYGLQLARNDSFLLLRTNVLLAIICLVALMFLNSGNGLILASSLWVFINLTYNFLTTPQTYRRAFKESYYAWFLRNQLFPVLVCVASVWGSARIGAPYFAPKSPFGLLLLLLIVWSCGMVGAVVCYPELVRKGIDALRFQANDSRK